MSRKFTLTQILVKLRAAEGELANGLSVNEVCRKLAVSELTLYRWRFQYASLPADAARRCEELQADNERLKRLVLQLRLEKQLLHETAGHLGLSGVSLPSHAGRRLTRVCRPRRAVRNN